MLTVALRARGAPLSLLVPCHWDVAIMLWCVDWWWKQHLSPARTSCGAQKGMLAKYGVELIGAKLPSIDRAEDRELFKQSMKRIGLGVPQSGARGQGLEAGCLGPAWWGRGGMSTFRRRARCMDKDCTERLHMRHTAWRMPRMGHRLLSSCCAAWLMGISGPTAVGCAAQPGRHGPCPNTTNTTAAQM